MNWFQRVRLWEISLAVLVAFTSYFIYQVAQESHQVTNQTVVVLSHADKTLTTIDTTVSGIGSSVGNVAVGLLSNENQLTVALNKVNQPCIPVKGQILTLADSKNCGTLADFSRTLQTLRGTIGTIETAGLNFDSHQGDLYTQESTLFTHTDNLIASFSPIPGHLDKTLTDFDAFTASPDVLGTIRHFNTITGNFGDMSDTANKKFQAFINPPPCKGFKCHLSQDIQGIRLASQFTEPAYWALQIFNSVH